MEQSFKTKSGYCHLTKETLLISRNEEIVKEVNSKLDITSIFLGGVALMSFYFCISFIFNGINATAVSAETKPGINPFMIAAIYGLVGVVLLINLLINRNKTSDYVIKLDTISNIEFKEGSKIAKPIFIVQYLKKGKSVNRVIAMKSDETELESAKRILQKIGATNF